MISKGILGTFLGLVAGLLIGFTFANYLNKNEDRALGGPAPAVPGVQADSRNAPGSMPPEIQKTLDEAKNNPKNAEAQLKAGDLYAQIQRFDEALMFFKKAAEINPDNLEANAGLGRIYFEKKDFEQAGVYFQKAAELNGKDAGLRSDLGLTYYLREPPEIERAISEYRLAFKIDPKHEPTLQNLCVALKTSGNEAELAKTMDLLRKVNPKNPFLEKFSAN